MYECRPQAISRKVCGDHCRPKTTAYCEQSPTQRHFGYANLAGYPAINLPNGFADTGGPTNAVIYAQPFREQEIIALAKAYQDAAGFHLIKPTKLDQPTTTQAQ